MVEIFDDEAVFVSQQRAAQHRNSVTPAYLQDSIKF